MIEQKKNDWMVYVSCPTFNHASYIVDAMNGFAIQETNFPFVCAIIDDASTDGEQKIINNYLNEHFDLEDKIIVRQEETDDYILTYARHKTNLNCYFAIFYLKYNHYSIKKSKVPYISEWRDTAKFIAICEGDDYWTNPHKLQKQADILLNNDNIGLVFTKDILLNEIVGKKTERSLSPEIRLDDNFKWKIIDQSVMIGTNTTMIKRDLYQKIKSIKEDFEGFLMGDTQLWFHSARLSKVAYIPEAMSVYRKQPTGATGVFNLQKRITFLNSCLDLDLHLAYKYGAPKDSIHRIMKIFFIQIFSRYLLINDFSNAQMLSKRIIDNAWLMKPFITYTKIVGRFPSRVFRKLFESMDRKGIIKYHYK